MKYTLMLLVLLGGLGMADPNCGAQDEFAEAAEKEQDQEAVPKIPRGRRFYMGREIAMTMHYSGAEWLIRNEREREERCSLMLANLGVKKGMTVCDMGCGNGFHTLQIAEMVGQQGSVFGVDVQPEMLNLLRKRFEKRGLENIVPILGSFHNPHLPKNSVDMILLVDVYHEFSHPEYMLKAMHESLKPGGVIVLVEFRLEDPDVPIKLLHKMSKQQVRKEMEANRFKLVKQFDKLPWQHMLFYGKAESSQADSSK
ncbi:MAG: methyltransferase domain-containing protein [Planctomycetota bacterium]|nr:methyltransferase domain-containing protein [Planctomycetota bacterium]